MNKEKARFIWSDNWYIEGDKVWFVDGVLNLIFCLDMKNKECTKIAEIPNSNSCTFRLNPRCIKIENEIYCMPDIGESIWVYDLNKRIFYEIRIANPKKVRICITDFWNYGEKIYAFSCGLKQILEINVRTKEIENYYIVCDDPNIELINCVKVKEQIYCVSRPYNQIYQFDLEKKNVFIHSVKGIDDHFYTICFDGENFWLSGFSKQIYIWNKKNVKVLRDFPAEFGIYDFFSEKEDVLDCEKERYEAPAFLETRVVGQYVWFIPFRTNKILYVDKTNYQINQLDIPQERENRTSLATNEMLHKFLLEYEYNNRYIGLFSFKNRNILEIDTERIKVSNKIFSLDGNYLNEKICSDNVLFCEGNYPDREFFKRYLLSNVRFTMEENKNNIGKKIFKKVKRIAEGE